MSSILKTPGTPPSQLRRSNSNVKFSHEMGELSSPTHTTSPDSLGVPRITIEQEHPLDASQSSTHNAMKIIIPANGEYLRDSINIASSSMPMRHNDDQDDMYSSQTDASIPRALGSPNGSHRRSRNHYHHSEKNTHPLSNELNRDGSDVDPHTFGRTLNPNDLNDRDRIVSVSTSGSLSSRYPFAREISETISTKFYEMRWCWLAITVNSILIFYNFKMTSGLTVPLPDSVVTSVGCVVIELVLLISNIITFRALDDGASAYFGSLLSNPKGFSLTVCGFFQASPFQKWPFATQLSLNSSCRTLFSRVSIIWLFLEIMKWLTPLSATAIHGSSTRVDTGTVNCIIYTQEGIPSDRGWPNIVVESGIGELIFGSALGSMRSEQSVDYTTFVMSPQIIGTVDDGDTMVGDGFTANLYTTCSCYNNAKANTFISGLYSQTKSTSLLAAYQSLGSNFGMATLINVSSSEIDVINIFSGTQLCGGGNGTFFPVCRTNITDHNHATVVVRYMTDGTTASIAPQKVEIRAVGDPADMYNWLSQATLDIYGGEITSTLLPSTIPGVINPLMWWATPNLMTIDPVLIESGIETMVSILLRAGIQRTYSTRGEVCIRNVAVPGLSIIKMDDYGSQVALFTLSFQLAISVLAIVGFIPWILSQHPLGPAVRVVKEPVFFTTLVNSSSVCHGFDQLCNAQIHAIWQNLDIIVRIGEPIGTTTEPIGHISMDRPKLMGWLTNGKKYF